MGNESDSGARMEEIGGMIVHAEAAQAALDKGLAAHAENVANITRLIQSIPTQIATAPDLATIPAEDPKTLWPNHN
ncbi:MAG: hypothetical protein ACLP4V_06275 [Methylocella sp.]